MSEILEKEVKEKGKMPIESKGKNSKNTSSTVRLTGTIIDTIIEWEDSPESDDFWA
ncbi:MAG: hypothetical protein JEZ09_02715 [Salinivirgaceae bacterium]|nr:hypothetical protein [Salinivirgaceae bacterium]